MKLRSPAGLAGLVLALLLAAPAVAAPVDRRPARRGRQRARCSRARSRPTYAASASPATAVDARCDGTAANSGRARRRCRRAAPRSRGRRADAVRHRRNLGRAVRRPRFSDDPGRARRARPGDDRFLAESRTASGSDFGACGDPIQTGDEVLLLVDGYARLRATASLDALAARPRPRPGAHGHRARRPTPATATPVRPARPSAGVTTDADGRADVGRSTARAGRRCRRPRPARVRSATDRGCA